MPIATLVWKLYTVKVENLVNAQSAPFVKSGHIYYLYAWETLKLWEQYFEDREGSGT